MNEVPPMRIEYMRTRIMFCRCVIMYDVCIAFQGRSLYFSSVLRFCIYKIEHLPSLAFEYCLLLFSLFYFIYTGDEVGMSSHRRGSNGRSKTARSSTRWCHAQSLAQGFEHPAV
jgi:hypothetical protein